MSPPSIPRPAPSLHRPRTAHASGRCRPVPTGRGRSFSGPARRRSPSSSLRISPPSPSLLAAPRRGAEVVGPAALSAQRSGVGTAGKVTDRGALRDGEGLGRAGGHAAAPPSPFRAPRAFRAGWRSRSALRGAPRRGRAGTRRRGEGLTAEQPRRSPPGRGAELPGTRCRARRPALPPRGSALPQRPARSRSDYSRRLLSAQCVRSR